MSNRHPAASEARLVFVIDHFYTAGHVLPQNISCAKRVKQFAALLKFSCWKEGKSTPSTVKDKGIWGTQSESDSPCSSTLLNTGWIHPEIPDEQGSFLNRYRD